MSFLNEIPKISDLNPKDPNYEDKLVEAFDKLYQLDYDLAYKKQDDIDNQPVPKITLHTLQIEFNAHLDAIVDRYKITPINEEIYANNFCKIFTIAGKYIFEVNANLNGIEELDWTPITHIKRTTFEKPQDLQSWHPSQTNNIYLVEFPGLRLPSGIVSNAIYAVALRRETSANNLENMALLQKYVKYRGDK
jgi:hypothetical protein